MSQDFEIKSARVTDRSAVPWWRMQDFVSGPLTDTERLFKEWDAASRQLNQIFLSDSHLKLKNAAKSVLEKVFFFAFL